ncbi:hypothetical protein BSPWISOXPB_562 [uncultured Gammaproteobacteria bacterium]|nr:hypothetical protein BSPWISOXPB_562 [uncultured Gammaproteobacteria bacterium]
MSELVGDLQADKKYYQTNIALAASSLAAKTTALAAQLATAAASSGTYGFNAGIEFDIDALERQLQAQQTQSIASNLIANNININTNKTTTIVGSNLQANANNAVNSNNTNNGQININSQNLNILSSQDTNNTKSSTQHKKLECLLYVYGTNSSNLSGSISRDSSTSTSQQTTHNNTNLTATNINLNTTQDTKIKGANLQATNQLNIDTKNLEVSSVQNKHKAKTRSQGASLGIGSSGVNSVGFNQSKADENSKTVLLTSMTAKQVNINTQAHTQLTGSLIAATDTGDKDGNDNGQLNLTTNSLSASSLNTTTNNKSNSIGLNAGGNANTNSAKLNRVSLDYTNNKHNSKTKVLATLGSGNIQIADIDQNNSNPSPIQF